MKIIHKWLLIAILLSFTPNVFAYQLMSCGSTPAHWPNRTYKTYIAPVSFPSGSDWWNALQRAVTLVNRNPSNYWMSAVQGNNQVARYNGRNEVWFSANSTELGGFTAVTWSKWNNKCELTEADVLFSIAEKWTTSNFAGYAWGYGGYYRPITGTAIHELGHAAGLGHEGRYYNIMGADYTFTHRNGTIAESYLGEDSANALVKVYGLVPYINYQDLSVTHWYRSGESGGYSDHKRLPLLSSSGSVLSCTPQYNVGHCNGDGSEGDQYYKVTRGQTIQYPIGLENNGRDSKTVNVRFYLSTDNNISTADTYLTQGTVTITRDLPNYYNIPVTLPTSLTVGKVYYLGVIVDATNTVSELDETNNSTYTGIKVY